MKTNFTLSQLNSTLSRIALPVALALCLAGCGGSSTQPSTPSNPQPQTPSAPALSSIAVTSGSASIAVNATLQFAATGTYSDASTKSLTGEVTWSSSAPNVATVNSSGIVTAIASGATTITATVGTVSGSKVLLVTPILTSISVTPASATAPVNATAQFTATGTWSNGSTQDITAQVTWSSSDFAIATIDGFGLATAVASGNATMTATLGAISGSGTLIVTPILTTINLTPASPTAVVNTSTQFTATGVWSDGSAQDLSAQVTWSSADSSIATVDANGMATAVAVGSTTINAVLGTISGSTTLTVDPASLVSIVITPDQASVPAGIAQPFVATGIFNNSTTETLATAVWSSSNASVATIDNSGNANTLAAGTVTISATSGSVTGTTTFTVLPAVLVSISFTPSAPSLALGTSVQITAEGLFTDGSTQTLSGLTWTSSDQTIAAVDANGSITTLALGSVTVSGTLGSISNTLSVSVTPAVLASITVLPANPSVPAGLVQQFTATGVFTDSTTQDLTNDATWISSDGSIATVSASGLGTALAAGTTTISASFNSISGQTTLTVTPAVVQSINVSPQNVLMATGTITQLSATGHYSDGSTQDLSSVASWSSSNSTIASVDSNGLVTGRVAGIVTVTAAMGGVSGTTTVTVANHTLLHIIVTPINPTVTAGQTLQFSATGYYADNTTQDLTKSAHWSSSASKVATVNSGQTGGGLCTAKSLGTATITASLNGVSGASVLTVN